MARTSSSKKKRKDEEDPNPEVTQRKRLKALAFSNNLLSEVPAKPHTPLTPSNTVVKHHGNDISRNLSERTDFASPGTSVEHLVCIQGGFEQQSKGAFMESLAKFPSFQGGVRPLLSQRRSAPDPNCFSLPL